jgi:hypothetical protein
MKEVLSCQRSSIPVLGQKPIFISKHWAYTEFWARRGMFCRGGEEGGRREGVGKEGVEHKVLTYIEYRENH